MWGPLEAAQAPSGVCAVLGHPFRLGVNTSHPRSPLKPVPAPNQGRVELRVFWGAQSQLAASPLRCVCPSVPLRQVGTRGQFHPSFPSLLSTLSSGRWECPALPWHRVHTRARALPGARAPAPSPSGLPDQLGGAGSPPTSPTGDPLKCSLSRYPPGRKGVKQSTP